MRLRVSSPRAPGAQEARLELSCYARKGLCVSPGTGDRLCQDIGQALREGLRVHLAWGGVQIVTPTFPNHALGQLYGQFSDMEIRRSLSIVDAAPEHLALAKRVVDNAKAYFASKSGLSKMT